MGDAKRKAGFRESESGSKPDNKRKDSGRKNETEEVTTRSIIVFRDNGKLRKELLTSEAKDWADALQQVSSTQLRNFYNEVKTLQSRIEAANSLGENGFDRHEALIGLLKAKAAYAVARSESSRRNAYECLQDMICQCVDLSNTPEAFEHFCIFFEAVLGFHKGRR